MDEGAVQARAPEYPVLPIDAPLVEKLRAERAARVQPPATDPLAELARNYEYKIGPHDVLSVIVWDHPELTIPAGEFRSEAATGHPVAPDGTMFYPHVGAVEVGGKSLRQIRKILTERLTKYVQSPQLDVKVAAFRSQKIQVTGEVLGPSTLPITDVPLFAMDAVNLSKGFGPEADPSRVTLTREGKVHVLDLQALNERGDLTQNWLLKEGDVLHVPDRSRNKVFVLGEVKKPSSRLMVKGRMTLAEAIGDAEGIDNVTSNPGRIYVIRGAYEKPSIYRLNANSPDALLLAVQFPLQPLDVVYVSTFELTKWNRIMSQLQPTIQALWQGFDVGSRGVVPLLSNP